MLDIGAILVLSVHFYHMLILSVAWVFFHSQTARCGQYLQGIYSDKKTCSIYVKPQPMGML